MLGKEHYEEAGGQEKVDLRGLICIKHQKCQTMRLHIVLVRVVCELLRWNHNRAQFVQKVQVDHPI